MDLTCANGDGTNIPRSDEVYLRPIRLEQHNLGSTAAFLAL